MSPSTIAVAMRATSSERHAVVVCAKHRTPRPKRQIRRLSLSLPCAVRAPTVVHALPRAGVQFLSNFGFFGIASSMSALVQFSGSVPAKGGRGARHSDNFGIVEPSRGFCAQFPYRTLARHCVQKRHILHRVSLQLQTNRWDRTFDAEAIARDTRAPRRRPRIRTRGSGQDPSSTSGRIHPLPTATSRSTSNVISDRRRA